MSSVLIPIPMRRAMLANGLWNAAQQETSDFIPAVKLFTPMGACTWLLTELDPENPDIAFGLCDLGMQSPELGSVSIQGLASVRGPGGMLAVERDQHIKLDQPLSVYTAWARFAGRIVTSKPEGFA